MPRALLRVLLLDLDGTLCLGDEPALAYARGIAALAPEASGVDDIAGTVQDFLDGRPIPLRLPVEDGYMVAWNTAIALGVPQEAIQLAYARSRAGVAGGTIATYAPAGIVPLLTELRAAGVRIVLVTNASIPGLDVLLRRLGLDGLLDEVVGEAGKPDGLSPIVERMLREEGLQGHPERILSIGDIWENDLRVPQQLGATTALIDRHRLGFGTPDFRAPSIVELYPRIREWAGISSGPAV